MVLPSRKLPDDFSFPLLPDLQCPTQPLADLSVAGVAVSLLLPRFRFGAAAAGRLFEPEILVPVAVVDAVDHDGHSLDLRMSAGRLAWVEDDRAGDVLDQLPLDFPDQLLALFPIRFSRLAVDQLIDLPITVGGVVAVGRAGVAFIELFIGVVGAAFGDV